MFWFEVTSPMLVRTWYFYSDMEHGVRGTEFTNLQIRDRLDWFLIYILQWNAVSDSKYWSDIILQGHVNIGIYLGEQC